jgi:hypothetical protein
VQVIADINNALLPLWMLVLGTALIWYSRRVGTGGEAQQSPL